MYGTSATRGSCTGAGGSHERVFTAHKLGRAPPQWNATTKLLSGVGVRPSGPGIDWRTLDPASGAWTSHPLANTTFDTLWGNLGSLRAYDPASASLYVLVAQGQSEQLSLAAVDATGTVQSHAHLHGDVGSSSEVLMSMALG